MDCCERCRPLWQPPQVTLLYCQAPDRKGLSPSSEAGYDFSRMQLLDPDGVRSELSCSSHSNKVTGYHGLTLGMELGLVATEAISSSRLGGWGLSSL